jgi:hypothetical protein
VVIARRIWFRRNTVIHGGDFIYPNLLARGMMESYEEYTKIMAQRGLQGK